MVYLPKKYMRDAKGLKVVKFRKNPLDDKYETYRIHSPK